MARFLVLTLVLAFCAATARADGPASPASQPATTPNQVVYRQLVDANAMDAARLLNAIFTPIAARQAGTVVATADARTNTVVLTGAPEVLARAADLLNKLEQIDAHDGSTSVFFFYHPTRARAPELAAAMNKLLTSPAPAGTAPAGTAPVPASSPAPGSPSAAAAALGGAAWFVANSDTNSVLVTTDKQFEQTVRGLLNLLDQESPPSTAASAPNAAPQPKSTLP